MNRSAALAPILLASFAAGLWLFWPSRSPPETAPTANAACENAETCSAPVVEAPLPKAPPPPLQPRDAPAAAAPAPVVSAGDGAQLRAEADRLIAEGHVPEGIEVMRKATLADPTPRNHGDLGALLQRLTVFDEAAVHLRAAAELDPTNADRWIALANVYYQKVDPGEAWKAERRAREAEPGLVLGRGPDGLRVRKGDTAAGNP